MSDALYISVKKVAMTDHGRKGEDWWVANVILNGVVVAMGAAPSVGVYKQEGVGQRSAVSLAKDQFNRYCLKDIRLV